MAQLASARLSEREVPGSIFIDFNVCFDFSLIRVAIALNTRKTEHRRLPLITVSLELKELPTLNKKRKKTKQIFPDFDRLEWLAS